MCGTLLHLINRVVHTLWISFLIFPFSTPLMPPNIVAWLFNSSSGLVIFFRNMAMITQPQLLPSQGDENEISRSATIEAFHSQDVFNVLLTVGSGMGDEFQEQDVVLLEILFHLLKGVDGRKLFMKKAQMVTEENEELKNLLRKKEQC